MMTIQERYAVHGRALLYGAALLSCFGIGPMAVLVLVGLGTMATMYAVFQPALPAVVEDEPPSGITLVSEITVVPDGSRGGVE